jgi:hypothetical protein
MICFVTCEADSSASAAPLSQPMLDLPQPRQHILVLVDGGLLFILSFVLAHQLIADQSNRTADQPADRCMADGAVGNRASSAPTPAPMSPPCSRLVSGSEQPKVVDRPRANNMTRNKRRLLFVVSSLLLHRAHI